MKIGFCGTVSVRKTTLVNAIKELPEFSHYTFATERSKYLRDLGIPLNTDSTLKGQTIFLAERCSELIQENIITDRTVIDVMAFTENAQSIELEHKAAFIHYAHTFIPEYDWIFHVTSEGVSIEDNNVRTTDAIYRKQIERTIRTLISENLKLEEERFSLMLKNGMKILNTEIGNVKNNKLSGELAFKLYDTYGFPLDLTQDFLKDKKISIDEDKFNVLMLESKKIARASWKGSGSDQTSKIWFELKEKYGPTEFLGYNTESSQGVILSIVSIDKEIDSSNKNLELALILNQTPFYGESGGQLGDKGFISNNNFKFEVTDTKKMFGDLYIHYGKLISGEIKKGDQANLKIDSIKRQNIKAYIS